MTTAHIISRDEVMAYLDGELAPPRAAIVRAHVDGCAECGDVVAGFRGLADALRDWRVEAAPDRLVTPGGAMLAASPVGGVKPTIVERVTSLSRRLAPGLAAAATILFITWATNVLRPIDLGYREQGPMRSDASNARVVGGVSTATGEELQAGRQQFDATSALQQTEAKDGPPNALKKTMGVGGGSGVGGRAGRGYANAPAAVAAPPPQSAAEARMVVRTAFLSISTDRFDDVRARLDRVAAALGGTVSGYQLSGTRESGRSLAATIRVPVAALDEAMTALRAVGTVTSESQQTEEVTDAHRDLTIRIDNAKREAARLNELLTRQSDRLSDVLEVEQAQARVQTSIEQMTAEETAMRGRAAMSTIQVQDVEQRHAELALGPLPVGTRVRNAMVDGVREATESALATMLAAITIGPSLLLWLMVVAPVGVAAWWGTRLVRARRRALR